jgi:hypothetical protein
MRTALDTVGLNAVFEVLSYSDDGNTGRGQRAGGEGWANLLKQDDLGV